MPELVSAESRGTGRLADVSDHAEAETEPRVEARGSGSYRSPVDSVAEKRDDSVRSVRDIIHRLLIADDRESGLQHAELVTGEHTVRLSMDGDVDAAQFGFGRALLGEPDE